MKKMILIIFAICTCLIFFYAFSASYNSNNIDHLDYVIAIGVDTSDDEKNLQVSFEFTDLGAFSESSSSDSSEPTINTVIAASNPDAINLMNAYAGKQINLSHCRVIAFSEDIAKIGILEEVTYFMNNTQIRPTTNVIIASKTAKDYIESSTSSLEDVLTKYYEVFINGVPKSIHNTNELLGYLPTVYGVKTGYTSQAGRCLVSSAKNNNLDIIVIVLGADTKKIRTTDSIKLINYTFENYETINLADLINQKYTEYLTAVLPYLDVPKLSGTISTKLEQNFPIYYPIKKEQLNSVSLSLSYNQLKAPLYQGEQLCSIDFFIENNKVFSTNIYSSAYINKKQPLDYLQFFIYQYKNFYKVH